MASVKGSPEHRSVNNSGRYSLFVDVEAVGPEREFALWLYRSDRDVLG